MSGNNADHINKDSTIFKMSLKVIAFISLALICLNLYNIYAAWRSKKAFEANYSNIVDEMLLFSLLAQVHGDQRELLVKQSATFGYGGGTFELDCGKDFFTNETRPEIGGVFSCWHRSVEERSLRGEAEPHDNREPIEPPLQPGVYSGGDTEYETTIYTIFGQIADVTINLRSPLAEDIEKSLCDSAEDYTRQSDVLCNNIMYSVVASYTDVNSESFGISFVLMPNPIEYTEAGEPYRSSEWKIYIESLEQKVDLLRSGISVADLNSRVRRAIKSAGIYQNDLSDIGIKVEEKWKNKDRAFFDKLEASLKEIKNQI